ncbi:MAG: alkaline phosphatase [Akkermansiaceae bacterium]|nr:alkaline phosphatase [Akkermansiaceae bacterium]
MKTNRILLLTAASLTAGLLTAPSFAAPVVSRLTPPSALFTFNDPTPPYVARFLPGQRFDLQATVRPDAGQTITSAIFKVDGNAVQSPVSLLTANVAGLPANSVAATLRAYSSTTPGVHTFTVEATQSNATTVTATGNFEVIAINNNGGTKAKNIIVCIGDGMGIAHRTAARILSRGVQQGKALSDLVTDTFPNTGIVKTSSLNSIVTDSAPGAACYSTGNKFNNNQEGVFPDDTTDKFDNPRVELIGEYLHRTQGKALGIVTTADVFDATPAAFGIHTQDRGAGTGICDQFLDEATQTSGLKVLLGGGRKWFIPSSTPGSARATSGADYALAPELATAWGVATGVANDTGRDLIGDFQTAGFSYAPDRTSLNAIPDNTQKLIGLFSLSNMNVSFDKINGRRGVIPAGSTTGNTIVSDYGFPDQPMLDEMTDKALKVLNNTPQGFVLMVEGASIDKQAHNMDSERWILDAVEFDNAIGVCKNFATANPNTLIIVTADHECGGISIIGGSTVTNAQLVTASTGGGGAATLRDPIVGTYDAAGFPNYVMAPDGFPVTTDIDYRMLIGYAANCDRYEDWVTNVRPLRDSQQSFNNTAPLNTYPGLPLNRDVAGGFLITGQVPGSTAVHTAADVPVYSFGRGSSLYAGTMDNTDVFFKAMQAAIGGAK